MHVPLRDGKLSWKGFFPDKVALAALVLAVETLFN